MTAREPKSNKEPGLIQGWQGIAAFLGQPISVVERWAGAGMPIEKRGRYVYSSREKLQAWLGRESAGEPVHIATNDLDLSAELRRGLSYMRQQRRRGPTKKKAA